ncbi:MAG: cyanophycin synthetase [Candidatus Colwellbacteria bacterium]|nr:cyanophycin synthetase [Candidatus Colwellbacteria bacterium]
MKRKQPSRPFLGEVFRKLASKIGATVVMEPEWNFVGQITFKNGRRRYFRGSTIDLNPVGASDIAKDKDYAAFFMKRMGYPTVPGKTFFSSEFCRAIGSRRNIDSAYRYAMRIGFPVVVKPNSGSQGVGMAKVYTKSDFYRSLKFIFKNDRAALVQPYIAGKDYRIVVLDNKVISTYQRLPLNLMGDGRSTIHQLLIKKQNQFIARGRDTAIKADDPRIGQVLKRQGLSTRSVLQAKQRIYLLDNANLSSGGDALDVKSLRICISKF